MGIPGRWNKIFLRLSKGTMVFYDSVAYCAEDLGE